MTFSPRSLIGKVSDGIDWLIEKSVAPLDRMEMTAMLEQQARDRKEMTELGIISPEVKAFEPATLIIAPHRAFTAFGLPGQDSTGFLPVAHVQMVPAKTLTM